MTAKKAVEAKPRKAVEPKPVKYDAADQGSVWEFPSDVPVVITRPDGSTALVNPFGDVIRHVLDLPGVYVASDVDEAVEAVEPAEEAKA